MILSYEDSFLIIGIVFVCATPLLALFRNLKPHEAAAHRSAGH